MDRLLATITSRLVEKAQEQYLAKNEGTIPISDFL